jgi:hypothetical protein
LEVKPEISILLLSLDEVLGFNMSSLSGEKTHHHTNNIIPQLNKTSTSENND